MRLYGPSPLNTEFQRKPKSISSFVGGYKPAVITVIDDYIDAHNLPVKKYNRQNPLWQSNYHDHIIRNEKSYNRIKNYIRTNPQNWDDDKFNDCINGDGCTNDDDCTTCRDARPCVSTKRKHLT